MKQLSLFDMTQNGIGIEDNKNRMSIKFWSKQ